MDSEVLAKRLKFWFIIHFILDVVAALPLFFFPVRFLQLLGWQVVDPFATRLVAAALFGIGIESWLGRNGDLATFGHMLNLKIIWSAAAVLGIVFSMVQGAGWPSAGQWSALVIFLIFHFLWFNFRLRVKGQVGHH
jgi:hypothetical protein